MEKKGTISFVPPSITSDTITAEDNPDHTAAATLPAAVSYTRIKDVLDRLQQAPQNDVERQIAAMYKEEMDRPPPPPPPSLPPLDSSNNPTTKAAASSSSNKSANTPKKPHARKPRPKRKSVVVSSPLTAAPLDLSWKNGGRDFPKRSSMVGLNYQVEVIPEAVTRGKEDAADQEPMYVVIRLLHSFY